MATILWGHGVRDREDETTFVPEGITVKWYAELDERLATTNGFAAVETGMFGEPTEKMGPGAGTSVTIYNYEVSADLEQRDVVSLLNEGSKHTLRFVGVDVDDEAHLCNDVDGCMANGSHKCDGVFGTSTLTRDPELILLVCRNLPDVGEMTWRLGSKEDDDPLSEFAADLEEVLGALVEQAKIDPEAAEKTYDGFPQKSQAYATGTEIMAWLAVRWAADYGRKGQIPDLFKQLEESLDSPIAEEFVAVPRYADGFTAAARAKPEEFFEALEELSGDVLDRIAEIPGVAAARQTVTAKEAEKSRFASEDWVPDDDANRAAQTKNRENLPDDGSVPIYAGGVVMLIGAGHNPRVEAYLDREAGSEKGTLVATKGGPFKVIKVRGITKNKTLVEGLLKEISDLKVKFE